jgi:CRP/FNR family transcriptional regulator/CRP/FNR family cyclic AMP-dependent transcriptional regulator
VIDAAILRRVALFSELEAGEMDTLARAFSPRSFPSGTPILRESEPGDLFFVILRGEVKVFVDSPDGREVVLSHLQTGDFFGEMALLEGESRSASITALTDCELAALGQADFFAVLARDFSLTRRILQTLSGRLRKANEVIESMALLDVGGRLARYLLRLADETGQPPVDGYFVVTRPTHQEIANSIGATRETVTRMLKQFEARKLIRTKGSMVWVPSEVPPGARENEWRRR